MILAEIKAIRGTKKELRNFGFLVGGILLFIAGVRLYLGHGHSKPLFAIGAFLAAAGAVLPAVLAPLYKIWMSFGVIMGFIMTRIILGTLFYLVITPIGWMTKITNSPMLNFAYKSSAASYWVRREGGPSTEKELSQQF